MVFRSLSHVVAFVDRVTAYDPETQMHPDYPLTEIEQAYNIDEILSVLR
jgi:hypothetical protein